jgi:hypothetical protein
MVFEPAHCAITQIRVSNSRYAVVNLNQIAHLPPDLVTY